MAAASSRNGALPSVAMMRRESSTAALWHPTGRAGHQQQSAARCVVVQNKSGRECGHGLPCPFHHQLPSTSAPAIIGS